MRNNPTTKHADAQRLGLPTEADPTAETAKTPAPPKSPAKRRTNGVAKDATPPTDAQPAPETTATE